MAAATETEALRAEAALALEYQSEAKKGKDEALRAEAALALEYQSEAKKDKATVLHGEREQFKKSTELSSQSCGTEIQYNAAKNNNSSSGMENNNSSVQSHSDKKPAATFPSFRQIGNKFKSQVSTLCETCVCRRPISLNPSQICQIAFHILLAGGLLFWASYELHKRLQDPSEFHYTTCFITKMHAYRDVNDDAGTGDMLLDTTFVYGFSNNDWDQVGTYSSVEKDWDGYTHGDIGTCLYSLHGDRSLVDEPLTVRNYNIHQDTAAMWMVLDDKYIWINWIIFFALSCLIATCLAVCWCKDSSMFGDAFVACAVFCGTWFLAFWLANWPLWIMASVVQGQFDGPLSDGARVDDVYVNMSDCRIDYIVDTVYFGDKFSLVKYDVLADDGTMMAIDISDATNPEYFDLGSLQSCYKNMYTQQIVLRETASVEWLRPPTAKYPLIFGLSIVFITIVFGFIALLTS
eukprot:619423_1